MKEPSYSREVATVVLAGRTTAPGSPAGLTIAQSRLLGQTQPPEVVSRRSGGKQERKSGGARRYAISFEG